MKSRNEIEEFGIGLATLATRVALSDIDPDNKLYPEQAEFVDLIKSYVEDGYPIYVWDAHLILERAMKYVPMAILMNNKELYDDMSKTVITALSDLMKHVYNKLTHSDNDLFAQIEDMLGMEQDDKKLPDSEILSLIRNKKRAREERLLELVEIYDYNTLAGIGLPDMSSHEYVAYIHRLINACAISASPEVILASVYSTSAMLAFIADKSGSISRLLNSDPGEFQEFQKSMWVFETICDIAEIRTQTLIDYNGAEAHHFAAESILLGWVFSNHFEELAFLPKTSIINDAIGKLDKKIEAL